jgi:hypothetical protein
MNKASRQKSLWKEKRMQVDEKQKMRKCNLQIATEKSSKKSKERKGK